MTEKPKTYCGDLANLPAALLPLTTERRWVVWPWELRTSKGGKKKWTKPPRQACDPSCTARSNDPITWGSYNDAVAAVAAGNADGIGFMLLGSNIGAIDLDRVIDDHEDGELIGWAAQLQQEAAAAYKEVTVSGAGLRIIGTTSGHETHRKFTFDRKTGAGIELYRNTARYITISGLEIGDCAELPSLDGLIDALLVRHGQGQAHAGPFDFNTAGRQRALNYDELIRNGAPEGERSELFQAVVWHFAGQGWTADQIADELARHPKGIGAKYAERLHAEVTRSYAKWRNHTYAAANGDAAQFGDWPQIIVVSGELPRIVNEAEDALLLLNREIYQRGGRLVRPVLSKFRAAHDRDALGWRLIPVTRAYLIESLTCAARFLKLDSRAKAFVPTDAPDKVAETYLAREGSWRVPVLTGIVNSPFLRSDGSLCETPGYDVASGLLFKTDGETFPAVPQRPGKADAVAALAEIDYLIDTFPFVAPADRSVALSAILTTLDRRSMATALLHALTAPSAGTGKSLLVDIVAMIATGHPMPVISQGRNEDELEKRLGAALLAGDIAISLDNCEHVLQSALLCQALTQRQLNIRLLGFSQNVETLVNATIFATGNNLIISGDLCRRTLICSMDAHLERPELRTFTDNILEKVSARRGRLVAAALTMLRAWHVSGEHITVAPFGSFEDWSHRVREPLIWLGHADPCATATKARQDDPEWAALLTVVTQWKEALGTGSAHTIREIINVAVNRPDFHSALLAVAATRGGNIVSNERFGRWLKANEGKIVCNLTIIRGGSVNGYPLWTLTEV
jgi:hypothetical protein